MADFSSYVRQQLATLNQGFSAMKSALAMVQGQNRLIEKMLTNNRSITAEIDQLKGRRIFYTLVGRQQFTIQDNGRRGNPITMLVSQDGAFIQTHYPFVCWFPSQPDNTENFGRWRPVSHFPLPNQGVTGTGDLDEDVISISYEMTDSGSQRNMQNEAVPPILSRQDNLVPLPVPTLYTPNTSIQFFAQYEQISFTSATPPTEGTLVCGLPGYRVVNL